MRTAGSLRSLTVSGLQVARTNEATLAKVRLHLLSLGIKLALATPLELDVKYHEATLQDMVWR